MRAQAAIPMANRWNELSRWESARSPLIRSELATASTRGNTIWVKLLRRGVALKRHCNRAQGFDE